MTTTTIELTHEDLNLLIEAVKAWEKELGNKAFGDSMVDIMIGAVNKEDPNSRKAQRDAKFARLKKEEELRREQSVMIQAKLLTARRELIEV